MAFASDFFYEVRRRIPAIRRDAFKEKAFSGDFLVEGLPVALTKELSLRSLKLNAFYLWVLEQIDIPQQEIRLLDLGSKDFMYAPALAAWALRRSARHSKRVSIQALELDPYQIYADFFKRGDAAQFFVNLCHRHFPSRLDISYSQGDWLTWHPETRPTIITSFFPYLFESLHRGVGLPRYAFDPERYYQKILATTERYAVFFHQGSEEARASKKMMMELEMGRLVSEFKVHENAFLERKHPVHVFVIEKLLRES